MEVAAYQHRGGSGEPLVLLHPFSATWRIWRPVLAPLEERHDVLAVGLPGHFACPPLPRGIRPSVRAVIDAVERDLDAAGIQTAHLVGNSFGGWVALELARRGRARSVVAIAPGGGWTRQSFDRIWRASKLNRTTAKLALPFADVLLRPGIVRRLMFSQMMRHGDRIPRAEAVAMLRAIAECPIYDALLDAWRRDPPLTNLDGVTCPVLLAWPDDDRLLPAPRYSARICAMLPDAHWRWLQGCGHVPMYDAPELLVQTISGFTAARQAERARAAAEPAPGVLVAH